jgi:hypothetical protein
MTKPMPYKDWPLVGFFIRCRIWPACAAAYCYYSYLSRGPCVSWSGYPGARFEGSSAGSPNAAIPEVLAAVAEALQSSPDPVRHPSTRGRVQIRGERLGRAGPAFPGSSSVASVSSCSKKSHPISPRGNGSFARSRRPRWLNRRERSKRRQCRGPRAA